MRRRPLRSSPRRATTALLGLMFVGLTVAACDGVAPPAELRQDIVGGSNDEVDPAVVEFDTSFGGCTGTLVADTVVLTAAHCVAESIQSGQTNVGQISFGSGGGSFFATVAVSDMAMFRLYVPPAFEAYDIALVRLAEPAPTTVRPIPINFETLTPDYVGLPVRVVGFGVTDGVAQTGFGTKRQVQLTVDEVNYLHIGLGSPGHNTCQGDSGGPTIARFGTEERVIGVTSYGSGACHDRSYETRTDIYQAWINEVIDAWSGPCKADNTCVTTGCRTPDPDCDVCGYDGVCGKDCAQVDLDCPLGGRAGDKCTDKFGCESRVCTAAPDDPRIKFCSQVCGDPADPLGSCDPPLSACAAGADGEVCTFGPITPGAQGSKCDANTTCRSGICDPNDLICVEPCSGTCPDGFSCRDLSGTKVCRLPDPGGCGVAGGGGGGGAALVVLLALGWCGRRRR